MKNYQNIIHEEFMQKNTHVITLANVGVVYKGVDYSYPPYGLSIKDFLQVYNDK
ncbi:MAG: hypothetical protein LBR15_03140 [Methanobrevibacter sp.]|jgi:hypothetical protein|nr:hypothetical protein [Candidatus Methanovirga australis]